MEKETLSHAYQRHAGSARLGKTCVHSPALPGVTPLKGISLEKGTHGKKCVGLYTDHGWYGGDLRLSLRSTPSLCSSAEMQPQQSGLGLPSTWDDRHWTAEVRERSFLEAGAAAGQAATFFRWRALPERGRAGVNAQEVDHERTGSSPLENHTRQI